MFRRIITIPQSNSFFLFGARGTGKTSLLRDMFSDERRVLWVDLLSAKVERAFAENPDRLTEILDAAAPLPEWVVIDEVQKVPRLLDVVHKEIESRRLKFALTGSSARKLRRGGANLLAGRAFVHNLFPLTHRELDSAFDLENVLRWGSLPHLYALADDTERALYLEAYVQMYFKEEVVAEQIVRSITPFRKFLDIAAQASGTILNFSKIGEDVGVDPKTARGYFDILEDTLLGFYLPAFDRSIRKQQVKAPKFYLFDLGVKRALDNTLGLPLRSAAELGVAFEHFIICEIARLNSYLHTRCKMSYFASKGGLEIDLVLEQPGGQVTLVEIKSTDQVQERHLAHMTAVLKDHPNFVAMCLCREKTARRVNNVSIVPWEEGLQALLGG